MRKNGFSLIELIVATAIVTLAISLANLVYANYVSMDEKFAVQANYYSSLPELADEVREKFKNGLDSGTVSSGVVNCEWSLSNQEVSKQKVFNFNSGTFAESGETYFLNHVAIQCAVGARKLEPIVIKVLTYDLTTVGPGFVI